MGGQRKEKHIDVCVHVYAHCMDGLEGLLTCLTVWAGTVVSHTMDLPLPSTQLMAAGFLSVQKFPLRLTTSMEGKRPEMTCKAFSTPYKREGAGAGTQLQLLIPKNSPPPSSLPPPSSSSLLLLPPPSLLLPLTLDSMFIPMASPVVALNRM